MNRHISLLFSLLGVLFDVKSAASRPETAEIHQVPSFSVTDLLIGRKRDAFIDVLQTTGLLSIQLNQEYTRARQTALEGLCKCTESPHFLSIQGTEQARLLHSTATSTSTRAIRTTLATATVGTTPLALPQDQLEQVCGAQVAESMELLRDYVAHVSDTFLTALDHSLLKNDHSEMPLLTSKHGVEYATLESIVQASTNLEHFHVYSKQANGREEEDDTSTSSLLPLHTDAGLFLTFVPGMVCGNEDTTSQLYIESPTTTKHQQQQAVFAPDSIGIMLGHGMQHWLNQRNGMELQATKHAVELSSGQQRAWFGKMHLVPPFALVGDGSEKATTTFADLQQAMRDTTTSDKLDISIGCGNMQVQNDDDEGVSPTIISSMKRKRRLQHITNGSSCNNVTNHFCWMTCQDIPDVDKAQEYLQQGKSLYCLEPAVLASTKQVSSAVDACTERNTVGGAMNEACIGSWQPNQQGVTAQQVNVSSVNQDEYLQDEPWCYGGTTMYMDGFQWIDSTCVIYLFPTWVLRTPAAIAGACIATLAFGICLEGVIFARRRTVQAMQAGWKQVGVSTLMYGVQLTMGYLLMLVVMTYSGPLFLSVVVGLMAGHLTFNSKVFNGRGKLVKKKENDPTCHLECPANSSDDCCGQDGSTDSSETPCIPEGSTPCCQNTLNEMDEFRDEEHTWIWPIRQRKPRYQTM